MRPYPIHLETDQNGTIIASFPDVPEAVTVGNTEAEAVEHAHDALLVALSGYMDDHRDIPRPSSKAGPKVALPPMATLKLALYQAMRNRRMTQAAFAEALGCDARQVRRLLDLDHNSRLDHLERALNALGKRLVITIRSAA